MSESDTTTTFLVCFTSQRDRGRGPIRICLGRKPPTPDGQVQFFFSVDLSDQQVHLPPPTPESQPVAGRVQISESLTLSPDDVHNLQAWLCEFMPPRAR